MTTDPNDPRDPDDSNKAEEIFDRYPGNFAATFFEARRNARDYRRPEAIPIGTHHVIVCCGEDLTADEALEFISRRYPTQIWKQTDIDSIPIRGFDPITHCRIRERNVHRYYEGTYKDTYKDLYTVDAVDTNPGDY